MKEKNNVNISAPWFTIFRKLQTLFKDDPGVTVTLDETAFTIRVLVDGQEKAEAWDKLLIHEVDCGTQETLKILVCPNNKPETTGSLLRKAFEGNPALSYVAEVSSDLFPSSNSYVYCVFRNFVAQYWNDDLNDPHGITSTLLEEIARDVIDPKYGAMFSTDTPQNLGQVPGAKACG